MAKLIATAAAILTLLYFVLAVDVSDCRATITTTTTTTFNDETCEEKISRADLEACKSWIQSLTFDLPFGCCIKLYPLGDNTCRCEAMNKIVKEVQEEVNYNGVVKSRAGTVVTYCQIGTTPQSCLRDAALSSILKNNI